MNHFSPLPRLLFLVGAVVLFASVADAKQPWGHYVGTLKARFDKNGRDMILLENFVYVDPQGAAWGSPAGSKIDGASIPQAFWSVIGGPFEGKYREASVIHDVACDQRSKPWKDVHRTFYTAMRCSGVGETRAKIMYYAVYHFGPRWGIGPAINSFFSPEKEPTSTDVRIIESWIKKNNPDLRRIESVKSEASTLPTR